MYWCGKQWCFVGNTLWVMQIQRPCTCFWLGFCMYSHTLFIMQNSSRCSIKRWLMRWARRMAGQVGFFLLSLFICVLDKSYFCVLPLFISLSPFHCTCSIFPSPSLSIFFSLLCHLYSFYNCSFVWKGLRLGIMEARRHRDKRKGTGSSARLLHLTKGHWRESPQRYLDSGCSATATRGFGWALIMPVADAAAEWIEAAICCCVPLFSQSQSLRPQTSASAPASLSDLRPFSYMCDPCGSKADQELLWGVTGEKVLFSWKKASQNVKTKKFAYVSGYEFFWIMLFFLYIYFIRMEVHMCVWKYYA